MGRKGGWKLGLSRMEKGLSRRYLKRMDETRHLGFDFSRCGFALTISGDVTSFATSITGFTRRFFTITTDMTDITAIEAF